LAAAGQRIYCWGRPRTRYAGKTPEALATELYGVLGKKYANDTFCGNKHIKKIFQSMRFSSRASAEMEFIQAFNELWWNAKSAWRLMELAVARDCQDVDAGQRQGGRRLQHRADHH
jgi:hypothetical protein